VIAYGLEELETVRDISHPLIGTGLFFGAQTPAALVAVESLKRTRGFNPEAARTHAAQFAPKIFQERYLAF